MVTSTTVVKNNFKTFFLSGDDGALKASALSGKLLNTGVRSIAWEVMLKCLPKTSPAEMLYEITVLRAQYDQHVQKYIVDPRRTEKELDPSINNPLSQDEESPWKVFWQNEELQKLINQDIERCYPDIPFFQEQQHIKDMMLRILFVYAKENPSLSYRQGMHELLAPFMYLLETERKDVQLEFSGDLAEADNVLKSLLDVKYVEHDAFSLFNRLMEVTGQWFSPGNAGNQKRPRKGSVGIVAEQEETQESLTPVVTKCRRIQHLVLKNKDPELYQHLESLKVEAQLYLLRWVRLLLGREFHLDDTLLVWDAIFAYSPDFSLVEYICVAMLIFIRSQLLDRDFSGCMTRLFKYPPVEDVRLFIEQAINLATNKPVQASQSGVSPTSPKIVTLADFETKAPTKQKTLAEQQLIPVTLAPTFKHMLHVDMNTKDINYLKSQLRALRDTQLAVAQSLENIVQTVQKTLLENATLANIDSLYIALAEMKQAKDILSGFLPVTLVLATPVQSDSNNNNEDDEDVIIGSDIVAQEPSDPLGATGK